VKFWDSSAIIPLCLKEPASETIRTLAKSDEDIIVWWGTKIECLSALSRRRREGSISADAERRARNALKALASAWSEVQPTEIVRRRSERLLMVHPLRAADSLQLAAALVWSEDRPQGLEFISLDKNLCEAAFKEGFTVIP
jgi:predicted nucleic acid-binding protein